MSRKRLSWAAAVVMVCGCLSGCAHAPAITVQMAHKLAIYVEPTAALMGDIEPVKDTWPAVLPKAFEAALKAAGFKIAATKAEADVVAELSAQTYGFSPGEAPTTRAIVELSLARPDGTPLSLLADENFGTQGLVAAYRAVDYISAVPTNAARDLTFSVMHSIDITNLANGRSPAAANAANAPARPAAAAPAVDEPKPAAVAVKLKSRDGHVPLIGVLNLQVAGGSLKVDEAMGLTDVIRARLTRALGAGAKMLSREKVNEILQKSGKSGEQCTGECEVETGRVIGAEFVVTGHVASAGGRILLVVEIKRTRDGASVVAEDVTVKTAQQLVDDAPALVEKLAAEFAAAMSQ